MTNLRTCASRGIAGVALTVLMGAGLTAAPMAAFAAGPAPADDSNVQTTSPSYTGQNNTGPWPGSAATTIESTGLVPTYDGRIGKPNQVMGYTKAGESFAFSVTIPDGFVKERMGSFRVVDPTGQEVYQWDGSTGTITKEFQSNTDGVWMLIHDIPRDGTGAHDKHQSFEWHVAVLDGSGTTVKGRVFAEGFWIRSFETIDVPLYPVTSNGTVYELMLRDFQGIESLITVNNLGITKDGNCDPVLESVPMPGSPELNHSGDSFERVMSDSSCANVDAGLIFLDVPASDLPTESTAWADGRSENTWIRPQFEAPAIDGLSFDRSSTSTNAGTLTANMSNVGGRARALVEIDADGNGSFGDPADVSKFVDVSGETFKFQWDGKDAAGNATDIRDTVNFQVNVEGVSPIHFVREDIERSTGGIEVNVIRGAETGNMPLYWDDTPFKDSSAQRWSKTDPLSNTDAPSAGGVHGWANDDPTANANDGVTGSWGDYRYIHDWAVAKIGSVEPASATLDPLDPQLALDKIATLNDANDNGKADLGETLTYEFVVSNDGTGAALDVVVTDPKLEGAGLKFVEGPQTLEPGASFTFTVDGEYTVTEEDVVAGEVKNTATAKGSNVPSVDDSENTPTPEAKAELVIDKIAQLDDANGNGKADAGEQITWYFNVTNNGNVAVKDVQVVDEFLKGEGITPVLTDQAAPEEAEGETPEEFVAGTQVVLEADQIGQATFNGMLKPGQSLTFVADKMYSVDAADAVEGEIVNVAEPTGTPEGDVPMSTNEDDTHNPMPDAPKDTPAAPGTPAAGAKPAQPKGDLATTGADAGPLAVGGLSALLLAASGVMLLRRKNAASDEI